jgi:hypothetical protein
MFGKNETVGRVAKCIQCTCEARKWEPKAEKTPYLQMGAITLWAEEGMGL